MGKQLAARFEEHCSVWGESEIRSMLIVSQRYLDTEWVQRSYWYS